MNRAQRRAADRAFLREARRYRATDEDVAMHEAGHFLACVVTGTPVVYVRLTPPGTWVDGRRRHGETAHVEPDPWTMAMILLAGGAANGHRKLSLGDVEKVVAIRREWATDRSIGSPGLAALNMVMRHRPVLEAVAAALAAEREVTLRRLLALVPALDPLVGTVRPPLW